MRSRDSSHYPAEQQKWDQWLIHCHISPEHHIQKRCFTWGARLLPSDASLSKAGVEALSLHRYDRGINGSVTHDLYLRCHHLKIDRTTWFYMDYQRRLLPKSTLGNGPADQDAQYRWPSADRQQPFSGQPRYLSAPPTPSVSICSKSLGPSFWFVRKF